jgi:hypothetical protein
VIEEKVDEILIAIVFLLLGFLIGSTLSEVNIKASDIFSAFIAIAAVYGVLKWRAQHDYQLEKADQREITKLIKRCLIYCGEWRASHTMLTSSLSQYVNNKDDNEKTELNRSIVRKLLERIDDQKSKLNDIICEIESEAATNIVVKRNENLSFHIHCTLHRAEDCVVSANAAASVFQGFELLDHDETANFSDMEKEADEEYRNFLLAIGKVEQILGIDNTSKTKSISYRALRELDEKLAKIKMKT